MDGRRVSRRGFFALSFASGLGLLLAADRPPGPLTEPLPVHLADDEMAQYLCALTDLTAREWTLLAITAAILDPGPGLLFAVAGRLPAGQARARMTSWGYDADARRVAATLVEVIAIYRRILPADRAAYFTDLLDVERRELLSGRQVDYSALYQLITRVNREQGLMARPELDDLLLIRQQQRGQSGLARTVLQLLAKRAERRRQGLAFREQMARLLRDSARRELTSRGGILTLLANLGGSTQSATTYQLVRGRLLDLEDETLMATGIFYTAGDFLAYEPPAPPGRWGDTLPPVERAYAPTNALSPRLNRAAILAPARASRVLWPDLPTCQQVVAELQAL